MNVPTHLIIAEIQDRCAMRLYVKPTAPSVLRVLIFVAESEAELETKDVSELTEAELADINPLRSVPVLETGEGDFIPESLTICRYLNSVWVAQGAPSLLGRTAREQIEAEVWDRRAELLLLIPAVEYAHHTHPMFSGTMDQHPAWARSTAQRTQAFLDTMDAHLRDRPYLAGETFSIADITAFLGLTLFGLFGGLSEPREGALMRWHSELTERPCMGCLNALVARFRGTIV